MVAPVRSPRLRSGPAPSDASSVRPPGRRFRAAHGRRLRPTRSRVRSTRLSQIGVPAAVVAIVVMMVVPLPTMLLDLLLRLQPGRRHRHPAGQHVRAEAARLLDLPVAAADRHAVPPGPQRQLHPARAPARQRRQGHRELRALRRRRLARRRPRDLPHPRRDPVHRDHQRRRPGGRGRRPLHPRRHARQADGDRRRPQRRPHHRGRGPPPPPGGRRRGRLLRRDGRRLQVRQGRRHRRPSSSR